MISRCGTGTSVLQPPARMPIQGLKSAPNRAEDAGQLRSEPSEEDGQ